jgi:hypothetical protein
MASPITSLGDAAELVAALPPRRRVLVTGATGFIGRRLVEALVSAGHDVIVLARDPAKAVAPPFVPAKAGTQGGGPKSRSKWLLGSRLRGNERESGPIPGTPFRLVTRLDEIAGDTAIDAIVNLAGEPVANGLWTRAKRRRILSSRLRVTRHVVRLIARLKRRPAVLVSASAVGWYGVWQDEELTEFDGGKRSFMHRLCEAWERTAKRAERLGTRVVRLRIGIVLGTDGGALARLLVPFRLCLGGPLGSGRQWMSWIERDDLIRLIAHAIATPRLAGAVNATAPVPVTNATFAAELARALHRPSLVRTPSRLLHWLAGDLARELILGGQRVLPDKADASGFTFRHATLRSALAAMLGARRKPHEPGESAMRVPRAPTSRRLWGLAGRVIGAFFVSPPPKDADARRGGHSE